MKLQRRGRHARLADVPAARAVLAADAADPADLELPGPARLVLTAGWNLAESLGLPFLAYLAGERFGGQGGAMIAATVAIWLAAAVRKVAGASVPGLLVISGLVLTLQTGLVLA